MRLVYAMDFVGGPTRMLVCSTGDGLWELIDPLVGGFGFPAADRVETHSSWALLASALFHKIPNGRT